MRPISPRPHITSPWRHDLKLAYYSKYYQAPSAPVMCSLSSRCFHSFPSVPDLCKVSTRCEMHAICSSGLGTMSHRPRSTHRQLCGGPRQLVGPRQPFSRRKLHVDFLPDEEQQGHDRDRKHREFDPFRLRPARLVKEWTLLNLVITCRNCSVDLSERFGAALIPGRAMHLGVGGDLVEERGWLSDFVAPLWMNPSVKLRSFERGRKTVQKC